MVTKTAVSTFVGLALACAFGTANAAFQSCVGPNVDTASTYNIADNVIVNGVPVTEPNCTILKPLDGNANDTAALINTEAFFGAQDWELDGRFNVGGTETSSLYNFTGGGASGSFTANLPVPTDVDEILFVFKDGAGSNLVGYLITPGLDGTYTTPFVEPPFPLTGGSAQHDVSHITVYFRDDGGPPVLLPEPGSLALLGLGLLGLGAALRRRG